MSYPQVPFVPTPLSVVKRMLELAELKPGEVKSFQVGYGEVATVLTERGIHVIKG